METPFARASFSSSDQSSIDASTRPTTPEWSPYLHPLYPLQTIDSHIRPLFPGRETEVASDAASEAFSDSAVESQTTIRNVCVIGAGYVGGPTAAVIALHNPDVKVTVLDRDSTRIASWQSKHLPIHEPGLEQVVRVARDGAVRRDAADAPHRPGNLFFSTDSVASIGNADLIFLAVNTPTKRSGRGAGAASDLCAFESAARDIANFAKNGTIVVEKSTVPCGTARLVSDILFSIRPNETFPILSNPEFLAEGSAIKNLLHPDRVLVGSGNSIAGRLAAKQLGRLYGSWVPENRILYTNVWSSELAKLVANAMLAQRISSMNSISALCEKTGADIREISKAIGTDARIGSRFLQAGLGFGGSCFRKDISSLVYISGSLGLPEVAAYWQSVLSMNLFQRRRFSEKIVARLNNTLSGKKIVLLGFAYKKDTGDTRESLAVDVIESLLAERPAQIAIFDPCCPAAAVCKEIAHLEGVDEIVHVYSDPYKACDQASTVAILTEWDFFKSARCSKPPTLPMEDNAGSALSSVADRPLHVFEPPAQEPCLPNCTHCSSSNAQELFQADQRLDWCRVARGLKHPRYVLDGRGILDERNMKAAGLEVDGLGWGNMNL